MSPTGRYHATPKAALQPRFATRDDVLTLTALMEAAIDALQRPFLEDAQIVASRALMGLDTQPDRP